MKGSAGWQRRQRPLRNLCLFASLRRSRAMMDAQHQKLAETLPAAPARPPPPVPLLSSALQEHQKQFSICPPAAEEEITELRQGSQEEKSDSPPPAHNNRRNRPTQEGNHMSSSPFLSSMPLLCAAASSSFHYHHNRSHHYPHRQPETQYTADNAGGGGLPIPSQLPTFSLDSQCYDTSAGGAGHMLLLPVTDTQSSSSLQPPQWQDPEAIKTTRMQAEEEKEEEEDEEKEEEEDEEKEEEEDEEKEEEEEKDNDFAATNNTSRIATRELFPGPGALGAVRAKLRQDVVHLKNHDQEGSHRYVMQEMALRVLERDEVEYIVHEAEKKEGKKRRGRRMKRKMGRSNTQQLVNALEELQRGVLAPVGLDPRQTRFLGLAPDILADISLVVQVHGGEQEQEMGAW